MVLQKTINVKNENVYLNLFYRSIPLMIQSVLPVAIFSNHNSTINMIGGTDVSFAPSMDYVKNVIKKNR